MIEFIYKLIIGSLWCFGIFKIFDDLLLPIRVKIEQWIGLKWSKPVVNCPACMGSLHGLVLGLFFYGQHPAPVILYMVCLCGLNYLIQQFTPDYE